MMNRTAGFVLALILSCGAALPAQETPWLHVEVLEGDGGDNVNVHVPLSLARVALGALEGKIQEKIADGFDDKELSLADIRAMWTEIRNAGDAELVSVESDDESVSVRRQGDKLLVMVDEPADSEEDSEEVRVEVPIALVDALFSGEGEELNIPAAVEQLQGVRGDLVRVKDGSSNVRVWVGSRI